MSVIVPVYQGEGHITDAVQSVLDQRLHGDIEVVVVDDGSTDNTAAELKELRDRRVQVITRDRNYGQSAAINLGASMAKGDYLSILGHEDALHSGAMQATLDKARERPDAVAVHGIVDIEGPAGESIGRYLVGELGLVATLRHYVFPATTGMLISRGAWERIGGWDAKYRFGPDAAAWLRLLQLGDAAFVARPLGIWRHRHDSLSCDSGRAADRGREIMRIIEDFFAIPDLPEDIALLADEAEMNAALSLIAARAWATAESLEVGESWRVGRYELRHLGSGFQAQDLVATSTMVPSGIPLRIPSWPRCR